MYKETVVCKNPRGIHNRPAVYITKLASQFKCNIRLIAREITADPNSIIGVNKLNIVKGTKVTIMGDGIDEVEAVKTIAGFIASDIDVDELYRIKKEVTNK